MPFDKTFSDLFTWPVLFFCVGLYLITEIFRRVGNRLLAKSEKGLWWWREVVLVVLPALIGALFALGMTRYPYPQGVNSDGVRFFFGLVCGGCNSLVVRVAKSIFHRVTATKEDEQDGQS